MGFEDEDDDLKTLTMIDGDGVEIEFFIIDFLEHESNKYILVVETDMIDDENAEATILKQLIDDDLDESNIIYNLIDNDEEFDAVATLFQNISDEFDLQ